MKLRAHLESSAATLLHNVLRVFKKHSTKQHDTLSFYISHGPDTDNQVIFLLKTEEVTVKWNAPVAEILKNVNLVREMDKSCVWFTVKIDLLLKAIGIFKKDAEHSTMSLTSVGGNAYLAFKVQEKSRTSSEQKIPIHKLVEEEVLQELLKEHPSKEWENPKSLRGQITLPDMREFKAAVDHLVSLNEMLSIAIDVNGTQGQLVLSCENMYLELKSTFQNLAFLSFEENMTDPEAENAIQGHESMMIKSKILQNFAAVEIAHTEGNTCMMSVKGMVMVSQLDHSSRFTFWLPLVDLPEEQWEES